MASIAKRPDGRYRARYADPSGKQHARHFERKVDASAWLDKIRGELAEHRYVDPAAGRITFKEYAERWRGAQVHAPSTVAQIESRCRLHFYPTFGDRELASIRKSDVQAWVKGRAKVLAPGSVSVMFRWFSTILRAACDDGLIRATPCRGVKLPRAQRVEVVPLATDEVEALLAAVGPQWQAAVMLAAGAGLRYGEVAGLTLDRHAGYDGFVHFYNHHRPHGALDWATPTSILGATSPRSTTRAPSESRSCWSAGSGCRASEYIP
jgi:integrase